MKSVIKIPTINNNDDVSDIREAIAKHDGVVACQISLSKKEVNIIYDSSAVTLEEIKISIEETGHHLT